MFIEVLLAFQTDLYINLIKKMKTNPLESIFGAGIQTKYEFWPNYHLPPISAPVTPSSISNPKAQPHRQHWANRHWRSQDREGDYRGNHEGQGPDSEAQLRWSHPHWRALHLRVVSGRGRVGVPSVGVAWAYNVVQWRAWVHSGLCVWELLWENDEEGVFGWERREGRCGSGVERVDWWD